MTKVLPAVNAMTWMTHSEITSHYKRTKLLPTSNAMFGSSAWTTVVPVRNVTNDMTLTGRQNLKLL